MVAHLGCTIQVVNISASTCFPNQWATWVWTRRLSLVRSQPGDTIAAWSSLEAPRWCRPSQEGVLGWILCGCRSVTSAEHHQFLRPLHWARSTAKLTRAEQPLWASRGLWRKSVMAGEGKNRQHRGQHVLEDLQEGDNRFHKNGNNSFCC